MKSELDVQEMPKVDRAARILFVDDRMQDYRLISLLLKSQSDNEYYSDWARDYEEAEKKLGSENYDIVAVDYNLGLDYGSDVIAKLQRAYPDKTYILITGNQDPSIYKSGIEAGADNFVPKGKECGLLIDRTIQYSMQKKRLQTALKSANASKDWLMSVLANDLCNPLCALQHLLTTAASTSKDMPREMLEDIISSAANTASAAALASTQLLDWGKSVNGMLEPANDYVNISEIVDSAIRLLVPVSDEKSVYVRRTGNFDMKVYSDLRLLTIVIRNLVSEAVSISGADRDVIISSSIEKSECTLCINAVASTTELAQSAREVAAAEGDFSAGVRRGAKQVCYHLLDSIGSCLFVEGQNKNVTYTFKLPLAHESESASSSSSNN